MANISSPNLNTYIRDLIDENLGRPDPDRQECTSTEPPEKREEADGKLRKPGPSSGG